jgi:acetyltransferase
LQGYRGQPPAKIEAVIEMLIRLGQLAADHPEIRELDINPMLAGAAGIIALDARLRVAPAYRPSKTKLAIASRGCSTRQEARRQPTESPFPEHGNCYPS